MMYFLTLQTALVGGLALTSQAAGAYVATDTFTPGNFFDQFTFFNQADPTNGMVEYVDRAKAISNKLVATAPQANNAVYLGVDSKNKVAKRPSVRIVSNKAWDKGLFIADIQHMPTGCGVWPAFWLLGSGAEWPINGEIDILEGVNLQKNNSMTLHTNAGCSIQPTGFSGKLDTPDCDVANEAQGKNKGCGIQNPSTQSYGVPFNMAGGGVIATEVNSQAISIWHFERTKVPADITAGNPDTSKWGMPVAKFAGNCNIDQHFKKMQLIFDTTFCGDWAGKVWPQSECAAKAPTCEEYVLNNPQAFEDAYFLVNSVKVYQQKGNSRRMARRLGNMSE